MNNTSTYILVLIFVFTSFLPKAIADSFNTEAKIYKALFEYVTKDDKTQRIFLIDEESAPLDEVIRPFPSIPESGINKQSIPDTLKAYLPATTQSLRNEFLRVLESGHTLNSQDLAAPANLSIQLLPKSEKHKLFEEKSGFWWRFKKTYPNARGIIRLSHPAIDNDAQTAIVYVGFSCGPLCGGGSLYVLAQLSNGWRVVNEKQIWVS